MKAVYLLIITAIIAVAAVIPSGCAPKLGGLPAPAALSLTDMSRAVEIANETSEMQAWLKKDVTTEADYRWLAIKWQDGEFSAFRSISADWAGDPNYALVPDDYLWYPAVITTFGDPAEWQITAAVDLELGKAVYVMENPANTGPQQPEIEIRQAPIHEVKVNIAESFPPQIFLYIQGGLSDGCTTYHDTVIERSGNTINVELTVQRPREMTCTAVYTYFERNEALGTDFAPGETYTINVNDYTTSFTMP